MSEIAQAIDFNTLQQNLNQTGYRSNLTTLGSIVSAFVPYVLGLAGLVLFLYLIWGGYGVMTSKGDPKSTAAARDRITRAVVGFIIIFAAFWLVQAIGLIFGVSQFGGLFH